MEPNEDSVSSSDRDEGPSADRSPAESVGWPDGQARVISMTEGPIIRRTVSHYDAEGKLLRSHDMP